MKYDPEFSDLIINTTDGDILAHRMICAKRCPFIRDILAKDPQVSSIHIPYSRDDVFRVVEALYICCSDDKIFIIGHDDGDMFRIMNHLNINGEFLHDYRTAMSRYKSAPSQWLRLALQELVSIYDIRRAGKDYPTHDLDEINIQQAYQRLVTNPKWIFDLYYFDEAFKVFPPKHKLKVTVKQAAKEFIKPYIHYFDITWV